MWRSFDRTYQSSSEQNSDSQPHMESSHPSFSPLQSTLYGGSTFSINNNDSNNRPSSIWFSLERYPLHLQFTTFAISDGIFQSSNIPLCPSLEYWIFKSTSRKCHKIFVLLS